jgi:alpha-tubulin suppressor-like RCC1 family protein
VKVRKLVLGVVASATALVTTLASPAPARAAVSPGGVPWTWGGNDFGQLGNGTTQPRLTPGPVNGLTDVVDLHGGRDHVIALRSDGTVWTWGSSAVGQLGLGNTTNRSTPTQVPGLTGVTAVETGHDASYALLANGTVKAWGLNASGQLGDGSTTNRTSPVTVSGLSDAVAIAAGRDMAYAIRADGTVVGWGLNSEGQVGDGTTTRRTTPVPVVGLTGVSALAGGRDHALALRGDGTVWAWGENDYGQIGDGTQTDRHTPVQVLTGAIAVAAGAHHSYALRSDHTVAAWGRNYRAEIGDGTTTMRTRPVTVHNLSDVVSLGSGRDTGVAVLGDGRVMAWGHNADGEVGDGTKVDRTTPVVVPGISDAVLSSGGGEGYSVVLVGASTPPAPQDPVAAFTSSCDGTSCTFDASASHDPDGTVASYDWTFGDGASESDTTASAAHVFPDFGTYDVTLTVTDNSGATGTVDHQVVVQDQPPPPTGPVWRASASSDSNTAKPVVTVPASVQATDQLVLVVSTNRAATLSALAGWTVVSTVSDGTEVRSWVLTRAAGAGLAGTVVRPSLDATSKVSLILLAYDGAGAPTATGQAETGTSTSHVAPAATVATSSSDVLRYYVDKGSTVHTWTLDPALVARATTTGSPSGMLVAAVGEQSGVATGTVPALAAGAGVSSAKAIMWTLVLPPA